MEHFYVDHERPATPAHHPTAGVRILGPEIEHIAALAFPESELVSTRQLPSGQSYNNRIYFLKLRRRDTLEQQDEVVLKVNGHCFGANKVQNEVACLQIVQKICPDIPVPRILGWSEDGIVASFATSFKTSVRALDPLPQVSKMAHGGWILMTRVPGSPMPVAELDDETLARLGRQLGDMLASLRQKVPRQIRCGNIRLPLVDLIIRGILHEGIEVDEPVTSANQYYRLKLLGKIRQLQNSEFLAPNRSLLEPLSHFIFERLPLLDLTSSDSFNPSDNTFVLTHYDLSPRNVLVSRSSRNQLRISGLVDFEFAGFFPPAEEFLNDYISNAGSWPRAFYDAYLACLGERGVPTPARGFDPNTWKRHVWLYTLTGSIAPWDLPGDYSGQELREKVREAEVSAREMLERLLDCPETHVKISIESDGSEASIESDGSEVPIKSEE